MSHEIRLHPSAAKFLDGLDRGVKNRIKATLRQLENDPLRSRPGADIKILKGTKGRQNFFRLRIGNYRAIYAVDEKIVWVTEIFHRGKGYRI
jgi:mRNA interferase RelE/StbE